MPATGKQSSSTEVTWSWSLSASSASSSGGESRLSTVPLAAQRQVCDVDLVGTQYRPDEPDQPGHVAVPDEQQVAVEERVELETIEPDQAEELVAEHGGRGTAGSGVGSQRRTDQGREVPRLGRSRLGQLDPPLSGHPFGVDQVRFGIECFAEQSGGEAGGDQPGALVGHLASVLHLRGAHAAGAIELSQQQSEPVGQVEIASDALELRGGNRGHVDRVSDFAIDQEPGQDLGRFNRH